MISCLSEDERYFIFLRMLTGDEMSKRTKFAFITWCGNNVPAMRRARLATDKSLVKDVVQKWRKVSSITDNYP
ncbi:unnamed protein product [Protopolystoma xenopodis]|uniref:ADF-H domain-containing protein n=1 Tax=Protopolystoma xenopodis TaxID=117903 RepID=A0A3S5ATP6_9PLAT|nr:unnamed protein product [Protopolystoma xenopodis]